MHLMPIMAAADMAKLAVFLLADRGRHLTGVVHVADGGCTAIKAPLDLGPLFGRGRDG